MEVHKDQIERYGGHPGIRDIDLLLSALAMPQASFNGEFLHRDIFEMAAAYAFHICNNHPFLVANVTRHLFHLLQSAHCSDTNTQV
ncbi:MAG: hypothetical protein HPY52_09740 [Firmicutes bacterium]|nr:hypothetical protein [Bacillota bacterium]